MSVRVELCYSVSGTVGGDGYGGRCAGLMDLEADYIIECEASDNGRNKPPEIALRRWKHDTGSPESWHRFDEDGAPGGLTDVIEKLEQTAWEDIGGMTQDNTDGWNWDGAFDEWAKQNAATTT